MRIFLENPTKEIRKIVEQKAKYQKVMVIFDDIFSREEIGEIYSEIKEICIYNQQRITQLDENEIFNGYRLIIYCCSIDNFLKLNFNREEFINVFYEKGGAYLPYFLNERNKIDSENNYLIIEKEKLDLNIVSSLYFNMFYNYFKDILSGQNFTFDFLYLHSEINQQKLFKYLEKADRDLSFLDIDIIKKQKISYKNLMLLDLVLIDALILLFGSIKHKKITMVDVYKSARDEIEKIDKFYKLFNDENFNNLIILNYNCLYNNAIKTKEKIMELIGLFSFNKDQLNDVFNKLKMYSKNDKETLGYLYLFDFFGV